MQVSNLVHYPDNCQRNTCNDQMSAFNYSRIVLCKTRIVSDLSYYLLHLPHTNKMSSAKCHSLVSLPQHRLWQKHYLWHSEQQCVTWKRTVKKFECLYNKKNVALLIISILELTAERLFAKCESPLSIQFEFYSSIKICVPNRFYLPIYIW